MGNFPLVTVGLGSYNHSKYIISALESIRNQTYPNIELVIVDDCSKDDSVAKIEDWINTYNVNATFIKNAKNLGITKVCNLLLNSSNGKYLALFASDDVMELNRIESQVVFMEKHQNFSLCFSDVSMIDDEGKEINSSYLNFIGESSKSIKTFLSLPVFEQLTEVIKKNNNLPTPSFFYKTYVLKEIGGWDEELYFEDADMFLKLIYNKNKFAFLENVKLVKYRFLPNSTARTPNPLFYSTLLQSIYKYKGLSLEIDKAINEKILEFSFLLYQLDAKNPSKWLYLNWRLTKSLKMLTYTFLSLLSVKFSMISNVKSRVRVLRRSISHFSQY